MASARSVRARGRQGTKSLDLTIPAELARQLGVNPGDIFVVEGAVEKDTGLALHYRRVFPGGRS